jgi:nucleotide-binding universal stress UspA family protein
MKNLIVATDLSERGDRAVQRAFLLASRLPASLAIVTVIDDSLPAGIADTMVRAAEAELARIVTAHPLAATVPHEIRVVRGDPALAIAALAAAERTDLLILGVHRDRPVADFFRETTMERIVRQVGCPVLLVRRPAVAPYGTVVAAVDFSPASATALCKAAELAPEARLAGVHAFHVPYRGLMPADAVGSFLGEAEAAEAGWRRTESLPAALGKVALLEGAIGQVLTDAVRSEGADLIALGAHARGGLHNALIGSFAARMIRDAPCDLLIARPA